MSSPTNAMWKMVTRTIFSGLAVVVLVLSIEPCPVEAQTDRTARRLAEATIDQMGGLKSWNDHRFVVWDIFGESHYWDKWNGDFRWQRDSLLVLMNIQTKQGKAFVNGKEVRDPVRSMQLVNRGYERWVNNSYWLLMPYKLLDPGVDLHYVGIDTADGGQVSDVIDLTFNNVGLTPNNRFRVFIDKKSGMICQWEYFKNRDDKEPGFIRPWNQWEEYDGMWLATGRGDQNHNVTNLALPKSLPRSVFTDPAPVSWRADNG